MIPHSRPDLDKSEIERVSAVIKSGQIGWTREVELFETELARFVGVKYATAVDSGTAALHLALLAFGVKKGDKVIIPTYCCSAVLNAVNYTSATPLLADIDPRTFNIDPDYVKNLLRRHRNVKAIIVAHMFGCPAKVDEILGFGIPVIEDCAVALGARYKQRPLGTFGQISISSFYATKLLTTAKGGVVLTSNLKYKKIVDDLINYDNRFDYKIRYNYKMSAIQAAIGRIQLKKLPYFINKRAVIAENYYGKLTDVKESVLPPKEGHIFYRFVIGVGKYQAEILRYMHMNRVECKRPVFMPLHRYFKKSKKDFPCAEKVHREYLSIPIYPSLSLSDANYIATKIKEFFSRV